MRTSLNGLYRVAATALIAAVGGCFSSSHSPNGSKLAATDFAQGSSVRPAPILALDAGTPPAPPEKTPVETTGPLAASEGILDVSAQPGAPQLVPGPKPSPVDAPVLVDAKIGDVNGRPVFASKFLDSMADHLRAKAADFERKKIVSRESKAATASSPEVVGYRSLPWRSAWRIEAREEIDAGLATFIEDELLRAEAMASFTPDMRKGFLAWMENLGHDAESKNMGSRSAANIEHQGEGGLDEYLKAQQETMLVNWELIQKVDRRAYVSWREIKLEYDKLVAQMGSTSVITLRRVMIKADNTEAIRSFQQALADKSVPFEKLASEPYNLHERKDGGLEKDLNVTGDPATFDRYFTNKALNAAAQSLKPGEVVGPIKVDNYVAWLYREEDRSLSPLYFEQVRIERWLHAQRKGVLRARYIEQLKAKSTMTSVKEMSARLLAIADERYLPPKEN